MEEIVKRPELSFILFMTTENQKHNKSIVYLAVFLFLIEGMNVFKKIKKKKKTHCVLRICNKNKKTLDKHFYVLFYTQRETTKKKKSKRETYPL